MGRLDEPGGRPLIQTTEPVHRYPDFVRCLVRQIKALFPTMGSVRIAQTLARAGLQLGTTTIRRIPRDKGGPAADGPAVALVRRRRVVARYPGHTWHLDLTAVPIRSGLWVPWLPVSLPQRWPFSWCVAVLVDQVSRVLSGVARRSLARDVELRTEADLLIAVTLEDCRDRLHLGCARRRGTAEGLAPQTLVKSNPRKERCANSEDRFWRTNARVTASPTGFLKAPPGAG
jgi:hypothetical protein